MDVQPHIRVISMVSDLFIKRRVHALTEREICTKCYLAEMVSDEVTGACPFRFIEECCARFTKTYDRILTRERKRDWQEILDVIESNVVTDTVRSPLVRDPTTITQAEIDDAIEQACICMDERKNAEHRRWMDVKRQTLSKTVTGDYISRDDSSNVSRTIRSLHSQHEIDVRYAIETLGLMARRHGTEFLSIVGAIDVFVDVVIKTDNHRILLSSARAAMDIARSDGAELLLSTGVARRLLTVVQDDQYPIHVKNACAGALGWIYGSISVN